LRESGCPYGIPEEDLLRARCYGLLARLLVAPPDAAVLALTAGIEGDDSALGEALTALAEAARTATTEALDDEFSALFVGITRGELLPYVSYYLTGFLQEKPLARLRRDMERLGIARAQGVHEPEDHIAALCEMMHGMNSGLFGTPPSLADQRRFFDAHIGSWAPRFFEDLEAAESAAFYVPVGRVGSRFMAVEAEAFAMAA